LFKYYLGLTARTPAPLDRLPVGKLWPLGADRYLAMTYTRDKAAADVDARTEVSSDLDSWFAGPDFTAIAQTEDLDSMERVTVRDLTPVAQASQRYMRLRLLLIRP
jgi:hypothetical protein